MTRRESCLLLALLLSIASAKGQSTSLSPAADTEPITAPVSDPKVGSSDAPPKEEEPLKSDSTEQYSFTDSTPVTLPEGEDPKDEGFGLVVFKDEPAADMILEKIRDLEALEDSLDVDNDKDDIDTLSAGVDDSQTTDSIPGQEIRRQGDIGPEFGQRTAQEDGPPRDTEDPFSSPPVQNQQTRDGAPLLQLTQGGYQRPYESRNTQNSQRQKQEDFSTRTQEGNNDNGPGARPRVQPQVSYTSSFRPNQYGYGPGPVLRPPFIPQARGFVNANNILPTSVQNGFLNTPPAGFTDFTNFQSQFPTANDNGGYPNLFQAPRNVFESPSMLFQGALQYPQVIDPSRALQPQFLSGSYPAYETEDSPRPDYAAYFRHPTPVSPQIQIPANFFGTSPVGGNLFSNPPISLLSNYANNGDSPLRYMRYPQPEYPALQDNRLEGQQKQEPEATPEGSKLKDDGQVKEDNNKQDPSSVPFGTRLQAKSQNNAPGQTDFYMRYPVREAGYATEESLPSQNRTGDDQITARRFPQRPFSSRDPYRDALRAVQPQSSAEIQDNNRTSSNTPQQVFGRPMQLSYPQLSNQLYAPFQDRPQDLSAYSSPQFYQVASEDLSRSPFDPLTPLPETNYPFLNLQRSNPVRGGDSSDPTPSCARERNVSMCFEDADYPRRDVLYSLNSDAYLLERFTSPVQQPEPESQNETQQFACETDVRYGPPYRAKNADGRWKVIVNVEKEVGRGRFTQNIRLEVCRNTGNPCKYAGENVKTSCVQKFIMQSLLSWSAERGVHSDMYRLPVACACGLGQA